jgi:hypothetical protein
MLCGGGLITEFAHGFLTRIPIVVKNICSEVGSKRRFFFNDPTIYIENISRGSYNPRWYFEEGRSAVY